MSINDIVTFQKIAKLADELEDDCTAGSINLCLTALAIKRQEQLKNILTPFLMEVTKEAVNMTGNGNKN